MQAGVGIDHGKPQQIDVLEHDKRQAFGKTRLYQLSSGNLHTGEQI
jgi:hypothetical protein